MAAKFAKKSGFQEGLYVEQIRLQHGNEWTNYYRNEPEKHLEIKE